MLSKTKLLSGLLAASCLVTGLGIRAYAQSNPGFTIFSGVDRKNELGYFLDFGGRTNGWDRYRLRIPAKKMETKVAQFTIKYPNNYKGEFDPKNIEVRSNKQKFKIKEVLWDKENRRLQIIMEEPVPDRVKVELILSNVKNPPFGGTFYFQCAVLSPGDVPLPRILGTWILGIQ